MRFRIWAVTGGSLVSISEIMRRDYAARLPGGFNWLLTPTRRTCIEVHPAASAAIRLLPENEPRFAARAAMMDNVSQVDVVLANNDRVTLRVGDTFLKVDTDQNRTDVEVEAIALAPVPTPEILWRKSPVLALASLPGRTLGRLGEPSTASPAAWAAVGRTIRTLHDAPLPPWRGTSLDALSSRLTEECDWLIANDVLQPEVVTRNRDLAETALQSYTPVFIHGDLHLEHVFVEGDMVTGIIDWSEARQGDALFDIASITLANEEHLDDVIAGYGGGVDRDVVRAWWSCRCLLGVRWLFENGYGSPDQFPEVAVLRSQS